MSHRRHEYFTGVLRLCSDFLSVSAKIIFLQLDTTVSWEEAFTNGRKNIVAKQNIIIVVKNKENIIETCFRESEEGKSVARVAIKKESRRKLKEATILSATRREAKKYQGKK